MALLLLSQKSPYIYAVSTSESLRFFFQITPSHFGQRLENIQTHPKVLKKNLQLATTKFWSSFVSTCSTNFSASIRDGIRSENLGGQVVMWRAAAGSQRLLFFQNLEGVRPPCSPPLPPCLPTEL